MIAVGQWVRHRQSGRVGQVLAIRHGNEVIVGTPGGWATRHWRMNDCEPVAAGSTS